MKKLLLSTVLALGWFAAPVVPAHAQTPINCGINFTPQVGINCANIRQNTYSVTIYNLVPASGATDVFCLNGSTSKSVSIRRIELSGSAGTALTVPVGLIHRKSLDTGTAAVSPTFIGPATPLRFTDPAATATAVAYNSTGGNPTITDGSTHNVVRQRTLALQATAAPAAPTDNLQWFFGTHVDSYNQGLGIPAAATVVEQWCLNFNATTITSGLVHGSIEWTEE